MDLSLLGKLLHSRKEEDWFEFKRSLKLYDSGGKLIARQRDELIKDILGLANGNSHIIRKHKYLIIGVDDNEFDDNDCRKLYDVNYEVPTQSDIARWISSTCSLGIAGLKCERALYEGFNLFAITIPPTFGLHETTRELNAMASFQKHTVFMRQDENTVPASVREGITIQQLKHLHRQEIANPPSIWIGAIAGGIAAFLIAGVKIKLAQTALGISDGLIQLILTGLGVYFGLSVGVFIKQGNEIRYDWRYLAWPARLSVILLAIVALIILAFLFR